MRDKIVIAVIMFLIGYTVGFLTCSMALPSRKHFVFATHEKGLSFILDGKRYYIAADKVWDAVSEDCSYKTKLIFNGDNAQRMVVADGALWNTDQTRQEAMELINNPKAGIPSGREFIDFYDKCLK